MFKRANKITALLVAAASVMSVVPAMASTKLATKDGTIENAVAFKDGQYLYQGYRTSDDDSALYYNAGDKDKKLDNATTFAADPKFDTSKAMVDDGNDHYVVDLTTGKISDEDTAGDLESTATTKLTTKLNKANRYNKAAQAVTLNKVDAGKFEDVWYEYTATSGGAATYTGYTNASGTYIDASYNINAYFYSAASQKMVKIENIGDTEDGVSVGLPSNVRTLGQDDKYIYRLVDVTVTGAVTTDSSYTALNNVTLLQRIAKAQGDTKDDAYLPKTTDSYLVSTHTGNTDADDAATALLVTAPGATKATTTIVDGTIYVTYTNGSKVKTEKLLLRTSEKVDKYTAASHKDGTKVDVHVVKKDTDKDTDADGWTVDVNGNVWAIHDGEIKESTKCGDFTTVYTCDRSFNELDVYDENNLIAWDNGGDAYTTVTEGKKQAQDDAAAVVPATPATPATVGWKQEGANWTFYDATGAKVANKWVNVGGAWYFLKADGNMATGWYSDNGTWYFLKSSGAMATGWVQDGGAWYYLNASGAMLANTTTPDGYFVGANGAWVK